MTTEVILDENMTNYYTTQVAGYGDLVQENRANKQKNVDKEQRIR